MPMRILSTLTATLGVGSISAAAVTEIPGWDFVAQCFAVGNTIGLAVAARKRRYEPDADLWIIQTRWAFSGLAVGVVIRLSSGVMSWL